MADPKHLDIIEAINGLMVGITTANGFRTNVQKVEYCARSWDEQESFPRPWIGIVPQTSQYTDMPGRVEIVWDIDIIAHITPTAATPHAIALAIGNFVTDIRRALLATDGNLGVDDVHYVRIVSAQNSEGSEEAALENVATGVVRLQVKYFEEVQEDYA